MKGIMLVAAGIFPLGAYIHGRFLCGFDLFQKSSLIGRFEPISQVGADRWVLG